MVNEGKSISDLLDASKVREIKGTSDTIKVWEAYRDEALMWRAIALLQIPATLIALILCVLLWWGRETKLTVPPKPAPGHYSAREIPDVEFVETATEFVNLIASYQPVVARRQFIEARKFLSEPMLSNFNTEMLENELKAIESTSRTQLFFVDPTKTNIIRQGSQVTIEFIGDRLKIVAGQELPMIKSQYTVTMSTIPRNKLNPYGISILGASFNDVSR
jgi:hypothetical protein